MGREHLIVTGSWLDVIGLILSAIGATKEIKRESDLAKQMIIVGEGIQAIGASLIAIGVEDADQARGSWIEAAGAGTTSYGVAVQKAGNTQSGIRIEILGDTLQSLGAALSAAAEDNRILVAASKIVSAGAALEAIGAVYSLHGKEEKGKRINALGSWIQTLGGTISAIVVTKEFKASKGSNGSKRIRNKQRRT